MSEAIVAFTDYLQGYGAAGLAVLAFIESFIFPIPPDPLLISLALLNTDKAFSYAFLTTIASVAGGSFGYVLGVQAGRPILFRLFKKEHITKVTDMFARYGGWAVFIAAFTPIPYKVFTLSAGISKINFITFLIASAIGRGLRFMAIGLGISIFGERALEIISSSFEILTLGIGLLVILTAIIYNRIVRGRKKKF